VIDHLVGFSFHMSWNKGQTGVDEAFKILQESGESPTGGYSPWRLAMKDFQYELNYYL